MDPTARLIDANSNRAREALRVMEDIARFALDDAELCGALKGMRHDLAAALRGIPIDPGVLISSRDTPGDVGTRISTEAERSRGSLRDAAVAAGKRLTESLRALEEGAKVCSPDDPGVAARLEALRYRAYDAEKRLVLVMGTGRARQWRLCVLITESLCAHHAWLDVARRALEGGADCIQLREKDLDGGELVTRARALVEIARPRGISVIVNDRVDVALAAGTDGVHLGQADMSVADARRVCGFNLLVGVSTANIGQAERALRDGADYCGVGPMFPTMTKHKDVIAGPGYMREYAAHDPSLPPHLAIGGITPENAAEVVAAGARGIAVSSAVCGAEEPGAVVVNLKEVLYGAELGVGGPLS